MSYIQGIFMPNLLNCATRDHYNLLKHG